MILAQGCQDPTQVTLSITLDKKAKCSEIAQGTAITVGALPEVTEQRVFDGYVTAKTNDCDVGTNDIGTLVITPSDGERAAVVIVVGYGVDPTTCRPPKYKGCIVARRRFAFAKHRRLVMPITIDPDCADVPCDAFSTCNKGQCYDSETDCSNGGCERPGELPDGAVDEASIHVPDASQFDGGPSAIDGGDGGDGSTPTDGGNDGSNPIDSGPQTYCQSGVTLICSNVQCQNPTPQCCPNPPGAAGCRMTCDAPEDRLCCTNADCPASYHCNGGNPGTCVSDITPDDASTTVYPYCLQPSDTLVCNPSNACAGANNACCPGTNPPICTMGASSCPGNPKYCCQASDCPSGVCTRAVMAGPGLVPGLASGTCAP